MPIEMKLEAMACHWLLCMYILSSKLLKRSSVSSGPGQSGKSTPVHRHVRQLAEERERVRQDGDVGVVADVQRPRERGTQAKYVMARDAMTATQGLGSKGTAQRCSAKGSSST